MAVKHLYVIHHSHTDIGYTDLQERVIYNQMDYIRTVTDVLTRARKENSPYQDFRWNCETYFCVEQFLAEATEEEKENFFEAVRQGEIGISGTYLNSTDLAAADVINVKTAQMVKTMQEHGITVKAAMNADINGISMGARDALINNGVEFLFTNIHTHHGMYPLFRNQRAYFWENEEGKRLLVFNGEHYNLGNFIRLAFRTSAYGIGQKAAACSGLPEGVLEEFKKNLDDLISDYEAEDYPYDFIITSVSGTLSDNAAPNTEIIDMVHAYNEKYHDVKIEMCTLEELYNKIRDKVADSPVYRGDLTDWWANGVGSTPYAVKHFRDAVRSYHICKNLGGKEMFPKYMSEAEDNIMLYAEHTWGHANSIRDPYDTMVQALYMRKASYASKAHEASAKVYNRLTHDKYNGKLRHYEKFGDMTVINPSPVAVRMPVEFFLEADYNYMYYNGRVAVIDSKTGEKVTAQIARHTRGVQVNFIDSFGPNEEKKYFFETVPYVWPRVSSRIAMAPAEGVRDIENPFDTVSYQLLHRLENDFFRIEYDTRNGITSFYNKTMGVEMLKEGISKFFTPLYELSRVTTTVDDSRGRLGRNIRGINAELYVGRLSNIRVVDSGDVFRTVALEFELEGTDYACVELKMYNDLPKIDFKLKLAKTMSNQIESVFMPVCLDLPDSVTYIDKGGAVMRPGIDQIYGTCMEYYITDNGMFYTSNGKSMIVNITDAPLVYQGKMYHHDIKLCDNKPEYNKRDMYSWIMNNTWETNFNMNLAGYEEFRYSVCMTDATDPKKVAAEMAAIDLGPQCILTR